MDLNPSFLGVLYAPGTQKLMTSYFFSDVGEVYIVLAKNASAERLAQANLVRVVAINLLAFRGVIVAECTGSNGRTFPATTPWKTRRFIGTPLTK